MRACCRVSVSSCSCFSCFVRVFICQVSKPTHERRKHGLGFEFSSLYRHPTTCSLPTGLTTFERSFVYILTKQSSSSSSSRVSFAPPTQNAPRSFCMLCAPVTNDGLPAVLAAYLAASARTFYFKARGTPHVVIFLVLEDTIATCVSSMCLLYCFISSKDKADV